MFNRICHGRTKGIDGHGQTHDDSGLPGPAAGRGRWPQDGEALSDEGRLLRGGPETAIPKNDNGGSKGLTLVDYFARPVVIRYPAKPVPDPPATPGQGRESRRLDSMAATSSVNGVKAVFFGQGDCSWKVRLHDRFQSEYLEGEGRRKAGFR